MRRWILLLAIVLLAGCGGPEGAAGFTWGEDADVAARRASGGKAVVWQHWFDDFDMTISPEWMTTDCGQKAHLCVARAGNSIEGVELIFPEGNRARWLELRKAVVQEYGLSDESAESDVPYDVFSDGSLVRLQGWTLVVASPKLGEPYERELLGSGLGGLFRVR